MAKKKKAAPKKKKAAKKKSVKKPAKKKAVKKKKAAAKKPAKKKKVAKKKAAPKKKAAKKATTKTTSKPSLGRPKVTGDEKLFLLFRENYHARQIFDFLRVNTVKELEEYSPEQIIRLLTKPVRQTVDSIRRGLAEKNRCLKDDQEFVTRFKESN